VVSVQRSLLKARTEMRKLSPWRPEVEPLESLALLSGVIGAAYPPLEAQVAKVALPNPLHLSGSVHGTFRTNSGGTTSTFSGSGSLSAIGKVTTSGGANIGSSTGSGNLTLSGKQGKLNISYTIQTTGQGFSGTYMIINGTKGLAGETGSGTITVTLSTTASRGNFNATFG
jgi:hypothetical protein